MPLLIQERANKKEEFLLELKKLYTLMTYERDKLQEIDDQFTKVVALLSHFEIEMLPYSAASKFIYEINDDDVEYFFDFFEQMLSDRLRDAPNEVVLLKAIKLVEHLELASSQKTYLFQQQEMQLNDLTKKIEDVNDSLEQYSNSKIQIEQGLNSFAQTSESLDALNSQVVDFKNDFTVVKDKFDRIEKSTEQITVNLISILGIFAAILLGAYGSIQGFSNIFANAKEISIGKILMLSSIGASAVLLILFFLLSSVARLTEKKFGNSGTSIIEKHPIMFFSHSVLIIVFTTGGVIQLIKDEVYFSEYWLWLLVLAAVLVQVTFVYHTKSILGIFKYYTQSKEAFKSTLRFIIFMTMLFLIALYHNGYL